MTPATELTRSYILEHPLDWSTSNRFKRIGEGAFSCVYLDKKTGLVAKTYQNDKGYDKYLDLVEKHSSANNRKNPYLPKIYERLELDIQYRLKSSSEIIKRFNRENIVILERLEKATNKRMTPNLIGAQNLITYFNYMFTKDTDDVSIISAQGVKKLIGNNKNLWDVSRILRKLQKSFGKTCLDLHDGNFMLRKRGRGYQLVLTDPVAV